MSTNVARRKFFLSAAAVAASSSFPRRAVRAAQFVYRFGHPNPPGSPIANRVAELAEAIKNDTRGRLEVQVFPNSQLGSNTGVLQQLQLGSVHFMQAASADYAGVVPA